MNDLAAPFRQLVERRLWPLAVLLLAALAAVPFLLAKSSSDTAVPGPTASTASADQGDTQPIVSVAQADSREKGRKVLGSAKNPFRPAIKAKKAKAAADTTVGLPATTIDAGSDVASTVTGGSSPAAPSPVPVPTGPSTLPTQSFELYSLVVRFGETTTTGEPAVKNLKRLKGLPAGAPKLVYLGLLRDHKTAVFLVDAAAKIQGDGRCEPNPSDCQTLRMKAGDTVFADVKQANGTTKQYELDLVKIITRKTSSLAVAAKARAAVAKHGKRDLAAIGRLNRYRYNKRTGVLRVLHHAGPQRPAATTGRTWVSAARALASQGD